jgi:cathepsin L
MKTVLALIAFAVVATALPESMYQEEFTSWMVNQGKTYAPEELFKRYSIWKDNFDLVRFHNAGNSTYTMAMNKFADLTSAEFKSIFLGYKPELRTGKKTVMKLFDVQVGAYPSGSKDWSTTAPVAVTGVKDQGQCGSCWAFSATGSTEGAVQIKYGHLTSLSEQELVDCGGTYGNAGCNGGLMDSAFKYEEANGLCTEAAYPYTAKDGTCKKSSCTASANTKVTKYVDVAHNENALGAAVDIGPVSVAIEADQSGFQMYSGGVFSGKCGTNLDHGVLVVGYGTDGSTPYWKVKNSWGTSWGEKGYIRMIRNSDECGIANEPSYPVA